MLLLNKRYRDVLNSISEADSPCWLTPGVMVIQRGNTAEYVGVPVPYDGEPGAFLYSDLMIRARMCEDIDPRFVWYMLLAPEARQYVRDRATGSAGNMPKVNQKALNTVSVPVPVEAERLATLAQLDAALASASEIGTRIEFAARRVERSPQAVPAEAFGGKLIGLET